MEVTWPSKAVSLLKRATYRSRYFGGSSWDVQRGASIRKIRANSTRGSKQMPSSVRSLRLEWWRWPWRVSILRDHLTRQQNFRVSPAEVRSGPNDLHRSGLSLWQRAHYALAVRQGPCSFVSHLPQLSPAQDGKISR